MSDEKVFVVVNNDGGFDSVWSTIERARARVNYMADEGYPPGAYIVMTPLDGLGSDSTRRQVA